MTVAVAGWSAGAPAGLVGSLTAVPPRARVHAARALAAVGLGVHLDVVLDGDGHRSGVPVAEWPGIRSAMPDASVDAHVIVLAGTARERYPHEQVEAALRAASAIGAARVSANPTLLARHVDAVADLRRSGVAVWQALPPGTDAPDPSVPCDGVLVMLLEPGTAGHADPDRLTVVDRIALAGPVGVDGGVDAGLAARAAATGASVVVSGRALLVTDGEPSPTS